MPLKTEIKIQLDFHNNNVVTINAKQHDSESRYVNVTCTENGKKFFVNKSEMCAFVRYKKPDGKYAFNNATITNDGTILIELTKQMLIIHGKSTADLMIVGTPNIDSTQITSVQDIYDLNSSILSVMSFEINIQPNPTPDLDAKIESTDEYGVLLDGIEKVANVEIALNNIATEVINKVINDSNSSKTSTYSSKKLDELFVAASEFDKTIAFKRLLTSSDDFDDLKERGIYYYTTSSIPKNCPFENAGVVEVISTDLEEYRIIQRVTRYGIKGEMKQRVLYSNGWLDWTRFLFGEKETIINQEIRYTCISKNTYEYTGFEVTIPAKSEYNLRFQISYTSNSPNGIVVNTGSTTTLEPYRIVGRTEDGSCVSVSGYTDYELTLYCWGSWAGVGENKVNCKGIIRPIS